MDFIKKPTDNEKITQVLTQFGILES